MPKMKSHSASKKRFTKTGSGKFKRGKAYRRHHSWATSPKSTRQLRGGTMLAKCDLSHVATLLPYS